MEKTTIHLGLYGKTAAKTIKLLFCGLREQLHYLEANTLKRGRHYTGVLAKVEVDATGEVLLLVDSDYLNNPGLTPYYTRKDDRGVSAFAKGLDISFIKTWLAEDLRMRVVGMAPSDTFRLHPASKTSQTSRCWEVSATADALSGATGDALDSMYGSGTKDKILGSSADPIATEIAVVVAEETQRIKTAFVGLRTEKHDEMLVMIKKARDWYKHELAELGKRERAAVTKMKKEMNAG